MLMDSFTFTPGLTLDSSDAQACVQIKGASPYYSYSSTLLQIYPQVPSLNVPDAYARIRQLFVQLDNLLNRRLNLRREFDLPGTATEKDALWVLNALLNPTESITNSLNLLEPRLATNVKSVLHLEHALPFPLSQASNAKLLHTLRWVDTNIKLNVEWVLMRRHVPPHVIREVAEAALTIYALLLKMRDYELALSINFNHSIFLQDRILNLIFGDALYLGRDFVSHEAGILSNRMALELLKGLGELSYRELCTLAVLMGVVWTSLPEAQSEYAAHPSRVLADLQHSLTELPRRFCVDHIDDFLTDVGRDEDQLLVVILDDNGESAFDLALFQRLLNDTVQLRLAFIVNRFPVSTNISVQTFTALLSDSALAPLRRSLHDGRAQLYVEEQPFRSFEQSYFSAATKSVLDRATMAYIKGVNFFETLQPQNILRYYCFTVSGPNCTTLTGCHEGFGVFARVPAGRSGYIYHSAENVTTLLDTLSTKD